MKKQLTAEQIKKAIEWVEAENKRYSDLMENVDKSCKNGFHDYQFERYINNRSYYQKCSKCSDRRLEI